MLSENTPQKTTSKRGFASMDPQRQREIASLGGKAAHASGKAHEFNTAEAREAGRKGAFGVLSQATRSTSLQSRIQTACSTPVRQAVFLWAQFFMQGGR
jgi:general stress protein YciG